MRQQAKQATREKRRWQTAGLSGRWGLALAQIALRIHRPDGRQLHMRWRHVHVDGQGVTRCAIHVTLRPPSLYARASAFV
jgi:hypothetical protein